MERQRKLMVQFTIYTLHEILLGHKIKNKMDGTCHALEDLKHAYKNFAAIGEARSHGCTHKQKHTHTDTHVWKFYINVDP
jgi:hypothetical protein